MTFITDTYLRSLASSTANHADATVPDASAIIAGLRAAPDLANHTSADKSLLERIEQMSPQSNTTQPNAALNALHYDCIQQLYNRKDTATIQLIRDRGELVAPIIAKIHELKQQDAVTLEGIRYIFEDIHIACTILDPKQEPMLCDQLLRESADTLLPKLAPKAFKLCRDAAIKAQKNGPHINIQWFLSERDSLKGIHQLYRNTPGPRALQYSTSRDVYMDMIEIALTDVMPLVRPDIAVNPTNCKREIDQIIQGCDRIWNVEGSDGGSGTVRRWLYTFADHLALLSEQAATFTLAEKNYLAHIIDLLSRLPSIQGCNNRILCECEVIVMLFWNYLLKDNSIHLMQWTAVRWQKAFIQSYIQDHLCPNGTDREWHQPELYWINQFYYGSNELLYVGLMRQKGFDYWLQPCDIEEPTLFFDRFFQRLSSLTQGAPDELLSSFALTHSPATRAQYGLGLPEDLLRTQLQPWLYNECPALSSEPITGQEFPETRTRMQTQYNLRLSDADWSSVVPRIRSLRTLLSTYTHMEQYTAVEADLVMDIISGLRIALARNDVEDPQLAFAEDITEVIIMRLHSVHEETQRTIATDDMLTQARRTEVGVIV